MPKPKTISQVVREAAQDAVASGMFPNQAKLAEKIGVDRATLHRFMTREEPIRMVHLDALAMVLGVHADRTGKESK